MKSIQSSAMLALIFCSALANSGNVSGKEPSKQWAQWRGPDRTGHIDPALPWPTSLKEGELDQTWRVELGPSYSSPIITDKHVFVTETVDRKYEVIRALDRETGNQAWEVKWEGLSLIHI